ncbi:MAG: hypothetical protein CM15mP78_04020 [Candidatus Poseidoniales archaeon]|nr:MAG: hypothetical protein CM15mP78_04020 [Candidatus Poseidoniales archaeon]
MADAVKGLMDRITNDDPETRGQQLWVMFALALFLVATLNWYAYVREPEVIEVRQLLEYKNEVVKVQGTLISWVEDPYASGDDRVDAIIDDGTGVVESRWYRPGNMPPIGTTVTVMGDVIEYDGRIWLQSLGAGAMEWTTADLPEVEALAIADVAQDPAAFAGEVIQLTGFIGESISPDATFTSAYLGDHPNYGNSEHQMHLIIRSAIGQWVEATSKVEVQGILTYQQRDLRWSLQVQGPEILVDRNHVVNVPQLDWAAEATWSYQSGQTVTMTGVLMTSETDWRLYGPSGNSICVLPTEDDRTRDQSESMSNTLQTVEGRLLWSETEAGWCIDANNGASPSLVNPETPLSLMAMLSADPVGMVADADAIYTLSAYVKYAVEPGVENEEAYFVDAASYTPGWTTVAVTVPGPRTAWLETGQNIIANVSVAWDDEDMRVRLIVHDYELGTVPAARTLLWDDGATQWSYAREQNVLINGKATQIEGEWHLVRDGSNESMVLNLQPQAIGVDEYHADQSMTWAGRLRQVQSDDGMSLVYTLDQADVLDSDGDGLGDTLEDIIGTSPNAEDTDDDGVDDRTQYENEQA